MEYWSPRTFAHALHSACPFLPMLEKLVESLANGTTVLVSLTWLLRTGAYSRTDAPTRDDTCAHSNAGEATDMDVEEWDYVLPALAPGLGLPVGSASRAALHEWVLSMPWEEVGVGGKMKSLRQAVSKKANKAVTPSKRTRFAKRPARASAPEPDSDVDVDAEQVATTHSKRARGVKRAKCEADSEADSEPLVTTGKGDVQAMTLAERETNSGDDSELVAPIRRKNIRNARLASTLVIDNDDGTDDEDVQTTTNALTLPGLKGLPTEHDGSAIGLEASSSRQATISLSHPTVPAPQHTSIDPSPPDSYSYRKPSEQNSIGPAPSLRHDIVTPENPTSSVMQQPAVARSSREPIYDKDRTTRGIQLPSLQFARAKPSTVVDTSATLPMQAALLGTTKTTTGVVTKGGMTLLEEMAACLADSDSD